MPAVDTARVQISYGFRQVVKTPVTHQLMYSCAWGIVLTLAFRIPCRSDEVMELVI